MARGRLGWAGSLDDRPLPLGERFYVGGTGTVRGFRYGTAGPLDPVNGDRIGGNKELIFNLEYNFPIVPAARLKGLLFYDIGKAFDDHEAISYQELRHSAGWGFYWLSPIGPLRFEWGYIINQKNNGPGEASSTSPSVPSSSNANPSGQDDSGHLYLL